jgi:hypothetical protein
MIGFGLVAAAALGAATPAERAYAACPGQDVLKRAEVRWATPLRSLIDAHRTLRKQLGAVVPEGERRILWYANGGDLETTTFSVVAVRGANGRWHVTGVGRSQIRIQGAAPTPMARLDRELSAEESLRLDRMLADPCLYAGPRSLRDPNIVAGGLIHTLEVETPEHRWIGSWWGLPTLQEKALSDLIGTR